MAHSMELERFVNTRHDRWEELDALVSRAARGRLRSLTGDELLQLGRLYRSATSDLAVARRDFPHDRVTLYLNRLVGRAHPLVYQESGASLGRIGRFIRYGFPQTYRQAAPYIALAFGVFALSALVSAAVITVDASKADLLLGSEASQLRGVLQQHHLWVKSATENHSVAANFIMLNNITVAFYAFAMGILIGVGTLWVMAQNGISIGGVFALTAHYGLAQQLWAFVVPHGVIELSVVFMAGGAGMMIGDAILRPGLARRRDALAAAAQRAARLLFGCVPLLVIAGTIEGFFSPSDAPDELKYVVGVVTGLLLYSYLLLSRPRIRREAYTFADAFPATASQSTKQA